MTESFTVSRARRKTIRSAGGRTGSDRPRIGRTKSPPFFDGRNHAIKPARSELREGGSPCGGLPARHLHRSCVVGGWSGRYGPGVCSFFVQGARRKDTTIWARHHRKPLAAKTRVLTPPSPNGENWIPFNNGCWPIRQICGLLPGQGSCYMKWAGSRNRPLIWQRPCPARSIRRARPVRVRPGERWRTIHRGRIWLMFIAVS